ncbi:hypothetical protein IJS64_02745 [bacterium]|nr:hypothetical protein [bacterium]MBQ7616906.1 hypothetical protein [bacterium]
MVVVEVVLFETILPPPPPHALGVLSTGIVSTFFHLAVIVRFSSIAFPSAGNQSQPSKVYQSFTGGVGKLITTHEISSIVAKIVSPSLIVIVCFSSVASSIPLLFISSFHVAV